MKFCWVTLNVRDMGKSLKFYHEIIGLKIATKFNTGNGNEIVMLGEDDKPKVELIYNKNQSDLVQTKGLSIGFEVNSLDEAMEFLKNNNIAIKKGPFSPTPTTRFLFVDDPDGIEVQIVENY